MSIKVNFVCDGCHAEAEATTFPRRHFHSVNGKGYGFGHYSTDGFNEIKPEGWVPFDPYTGCCYCPKCWAEIVEAA
jgi:hypothetical protein